MNKIKLVGYGFIIYGLIEFLITKWSCSSLCKTCTSIQLKPCLFLLIFVGVIFIVIGISVLTLQENPLPKVLVKKKKSEKK